MSASGRFQPLTVSLKQTFERQVLEKAAAQPGRKERVNTFRSPVIDTEFGCTIYPIKRSFLSLLASLGCWSGSAACSDPADNFSAVLDQFYPGFEVVGPFLDPYDENRSYRRSPESFVGDVLVGDFNFDGVDDFAAALIEEGGVAKAKNGEKPEGLTVVCSGVGGSEYRCTPIVDLRPYGFNIYLDLLDWTPWLDMLDRQDNEECSVQLETHANQKFLTIVEPYGHCDTLYYQESDGTYEGCRYCAD